MPVEQMPWLGGSIEKPTTDAATLAEMANVTVMTRTTAFGQYDGNCFALVERRPTMPVPPEGQPAAFLGRTCQACRLCDGGA